MVKTIEDACEQLEEARNDLWLIRKVLRKGDHKNAAFLLREHMVEMEQICKLLEES